MKAPVTLGVGCGLLGLLGCQGSWDPYCNDGSEAGPICAYYAGVDTQPTNECEEQLLDLGYTLIVQSDLEEPLELIIHYVSEPAARYCGGMVVEVSSGLKGVVGLISWQTSLRLSIPAEPPDQFRVVAWANMDVEEDPHDQADADGLFWANTSVTADEAEFEGQFWTRSDQADEDGIIRAYLVRGDGAAP